VGIRLTEKIFNLINLYAVFTVTSTAPILVVAQNVINHWGTLVAQMATWSPVLLPELSGILQSIDIIPELGISPGIIGCGILEGILVGKLFNNTVQKLRECQSISVSFSQIYFPVFLALSNKRPLTSLFLM